MRQARTWPVYPVLLLILSLVLNACEVAPTVPLPTAVPLPATPPVTVTTPPPAPTLPADATATPLPACIDQASFIGDVTVPSGTVFLPGQAFVKTWRLRNSGTCTWTSDYTLVFASGDRMGATPTIPLPRQVAAGSTVELSVALTAPAGSGAYEGRWLLRNDAGAFFGVVENPDGTLSVRIEVQTTPTTPSPTLVTPTIGPSPSIVPTPGPTPVITEWRGEYFDNPNLEGTPVLVRNDTAIDFYWGLQAPAAGLPADNFSVRWTRVLPFESGLYRFHAIVDDGVRLWVDTTLLLDSWRDGSEREVLADITLLAGNHTVRVEYYDRARDALIKVWWQQQPDLYPDWKGEYWTNPDLSGSPVLVQNEGAIDFDWGRGSVAAGMPVDNFSARWTRIAAFEEGTYRFHILVDDGARLWVDDQQLIDAWHDGAVREVTAERAMTRGEHMLRVDYYERGGNAQIRVWWEKIP